MPQSRTDTQDPVTVQTDASTLRRCVELLTLEGNGPVLLQLRRAEAQANGYGHLQFLTYADGGWWEYNGVAVRLGGASDARSQIVSLADLASALSDSSWAFAGTSVEITLHATGVRLGSRDVAARPDGAIPPLPDLGGRIDRLEIPSAATDGVVAETQLGRLRLDAALVAHLGRRGVSTADLHELDGHPWLVAQAQLRSPANTLPVTLAPVALLSGTEQVPSGGPGVPAVQERRRGRGDEVAQLLVVSNPAASTEHLMRLLDDGIGFVRRRAASHPGLPREVIAMLVRDGTVAMRAAAAANPSIPEDAARQAADDVTPPVRSAVAGNPRAPVDELARLASDVESEVRAAAASNPTLPAPLVEQLAADVDPAVRERLAGSDNVDTGLLARLARDPDPRVCLAVARNPAAPRAALQELSGALPHFVLGNPSAPRDVLAAGAMASDVELRLQAARNPSTPPKALGALAHDADRRVLTALTHNRSTPKSAVKRATSRLATLDTELESAMRKAALTDSRKRGGLNAR